jgi:3-dehydroquinate synthase
MTRTVSVNLSQALDRSYNIRIEPGILGRIPAIIRQMLRAPAVFIITDTTVARLYGRRLLKSFMESGANAVMIDFPPGEASKRAEVVFSLHTQLLHHGIRRDSLIVALGGGVVGDVAGFVAATVLRGVKCVQVPTTVLAQVDSSVGGKVGIDHPLGKNLIGAFHQPVAVFIDPAVLRTLPDAEFRSGLAEMVKIAAALDRDFFRLIERAAGKIRKTDVRLLTGLIEKAVALKAAVVQKDEFELDLRTTLNLGHTIGHAIEAASGFKAGHGAAVSMGLVAEARIAVDMGLLPKRDFVRLVTVLRKLRLPVAMPRLRATEKFLAALSADKKGVGTGTKFVLLKAIGHSVVGVDVPTPFILEIVQLS